MGRVSVAIQRGVQIVINGALLEWRQGVTPEGMKGMTPQGVTP